MRILHSGDTHIGSRQYGLEDRRADFSQAFHKVVEIAIEEKVDAVVHAGDLFDDRTPSAEDLHETLHALVNLKNANIPFLAIVGNHEQRRGVQWIDLFEQLGYAVHLGKEAYELNGFNFYGLDYAGRREVKPPQLDGGVLVCHQLIDKVQGNAEMQFDELLACGANFVLLGDYHEHHAWQQQNVLITYCGSTERWSLGEHGARGVNLIDLNSGRLDRREIETREFLYISEEEDPFKSIEAHKDRISDSVVCVYINDNRYSIQELEEHARSNGALTVRIRDKREKKEIVDDAEIHVELDFGNLDAMVTDRIGELDFSPASIEVDSIIREPKIADSKVDQEITLLLKSLKENP